MEGNTDIREWTANHREEMLADIRRLVEIPSVAVPGDGAMPYGRHCARAAEAMLSIGERYGFEVENCGGQCVRISYEASSRKSCAKTVEIWNHLDVVPAGEGWVYPPFGCTVKEGFLIGRGVSDNKGPAIAVLYALRYLKEQGIKLSYDLTQVCGLSEECGMEDARWYVKQYGSPDIALISDCRFPLCYGEKGRCQVKMVSTVKLPHIKELGAGLVSNSVADTAEAVFVIEGKEGAVRTARLTAKGRAGHAAAPEKCINPIGQLAQMTEEREDLALTEEERSFFSFLKKSCSDGYGEGLGIAAEDPVFGKMTCAGTVLRLEGGQASLEFDLRFPPKTDINKCMKQMDETGRSCGWKLETGSFTGGCRQSLSEAFVKELLAACREVYKEEGQPYVMGGNTYARFFEKAVGFGPGIPRSPKMDKEQEEKLSALGLPAGHGGGHGCDEVQSIDALCSAVEIYVNALHRLNNL